MAVALSGAGNDSRKFFKVEFNHFQPRNFVVDEVLQLLAVASHGTSFYEHGPSSPWVAPSPVAYFAPVPMPAHSLPHARSHANTPVALLICGKFSFSFSFLFNLMVHAIARTHAHPPCMHAHAHPSCMPTPTHLHPVRPRPRPRPCPPTLHAHAHAHAHAHPPYTPMHTQPARTPAHLQAHTPTR